ncbi:MAG: MBL fold metallo-hydrolase [Firmicutes bacterium]|nr:MBL fold metallo-hydrolase [Bacillota bacterium]
MKLKVLVDNNTYIDQYFYGEPAAAYYIEAESARILFDTGYSDILLKNAEKMNINLSKLTHIVLSHGHNDHTAGLKFLHERIGISNVQLIAHPNCFLPKFSGNEYIGTPYSLDEIASITRFKPSSKPVKISDNLTYLGEIPRKNNFESKFPIGKKYKIHNSDELEDDYLMDDSALVYQNTQGIFIITGCSHSGICNIIEYAKKICRKQHILGILGGFHLLDNDDRLKQTIQYLTKCDIDNIYPCHCVSLTAKAEMTQKLPVAEMFTVRGK